MDAHHSFARTLGLAVLLLASALALGAAEAPQGTPPGRQVSPFRLGWLGDGLTLASDLALCLADSILDETLPERVWDGSVPGLDEVNPLDRPFIRPPSSAWGKAGDATKNLLGWAPALFILEGFGHKENILPVAVMYIEANIFAGTIMKILKALVPRLRPYVYTEEGRQGITGRGFSRSFPSGHTSTAFVGASFCAYTFSKLHPGSPWRIPVAIASYGLACFCGASRVAAGMHFPTDVLAGALIGTLAGTLVPYFHLARGKEPEDEARIQAMAIPNGIAFRIGF